MQVENECGLSNFIPILIGDERVCSEIKMIHQKYNCTCCRKQLQCRPSGSSYGTCEVSCSRQAALSDFMLDVAWLLKQPCSEKLHCILTSAQIQRFNCLLKFLINNKSTSILEKVLHALQIVHDEMNSDMANDIADVDKRLFNMYISHARELLEQSADDNEMIFQKAGDSFAKANNCVERNSLDNRPSIDCAVHQVMLALPVIMLHHDLCISSMIDLTDLVLVYALEVYGFQKVIL